MVLAKQQQGAPSSFLGMVLSMGSTWRTDLQLEESYSKEQGLTFE